MATANGTDRLTKPATPNEEGQHSSTSKDATPKKMAKKGTPLFTDAKAMKEKLRENMHKPRYDVKNFYWDVGFCQKVARDSRFENITLAVIAFNAIWISIDSDHNKESVLIEAHPVFIIAENAFCFFFTGELSFRFFAFKLKRNCLRDAWFVFDFLLVSLMIFETWIMAAMILLAGGGGGSGMGNAGMLRLLRLLRLSRMARMARLLRSMPELLVLIKGMIAAIRSVFFTLILLFLLLYVFSILFRLQTEETAIGEEKFPTIIISIHTLVKDGILFDGAGDLLGMMDDENLYILIFAYYLFVLFAALTVMNMLIGVLCEVISATAATETEELTIVYVKERLEDIVKRCCHLDGAGELKINKEDFLHIIQDSEATQLLNEVDVDVFGLVDLVDTIFATETGADRILEFGDLIEVLMDQRTSNMATVKDVTELRKYVRGRLDLMESNMEVQMCAVGAMLETAGRVSQGTFDYELMRRKKAHGLSTDEMPPPPRAQLANPEVVPEVSGAAPEMQASSEQLTLSPASPSVTWSASASPVVTQLEVDAEDEDRGTPTGNGVTKEPTEDSKATKWRTRKKKKVVPKSQRPGGQGELDDSAGAAFLAEGVDDLCDDG